jgi:3-deoxy-D-manno-octulosonate 8-phosphate phosphatase (KDO 8-P phosphatase)
LLTALEKITCFVFDVDGVLTNGTLIVMPNGLMVRTMNIKDGYAIQLAIKKGYKVWIISGGYSEEVQERLEKLGVAFSMKPTPMGAVTLAVCEDTCGNNIQIYQV